MSTGVNETEDKPDQPWRPTRGPLTRAIAWGIILLIAVCLGLMVYAIVRSLG